MDNLEQLLLGMSLPARSCLLWINAIKARLSELGMVRNSMVFENKDLPHVHQLDSARFKASSWCVLSKSFVNFSLLDIYLLWDVFFLIFLYKLFCFIFSIYILYFRALVFFHFHNKKFHALFFLKH